MMDCCTQLRSMLFYIIRLVRFRFSELVNDLKTAGLCDLDLLNSEHHGNYPYGCVN